jgi:hypothetical protein
MKIDSSAGAAAGQGRAGGEAELGVLRRRADGEGLPAERREGVAGAVQQEAEDAAQAHTERSGKTGFVF